MFTSYLVELNTLQYNFYFILYNLLVFRLIEKYTLIPFPFLTSYSSDLSGTLDAI